MVGKIAVFGPKLGKGFGKQGEHFHPIFNLEKIFIFFPSCSGGTISLHHSFTPSLPVRHLETRGELPYEKARAARRKI